MAAKLLEDYNTREYLKIYEKGGKDEAYGWIMLL